MRSNSALRTRMNHHAPAFLGWCNGLLRRASWWAPWRGSLDGMQEVRLDHASASLAGRAAELLGVVDPTLAQPVVLMLASATGSNVPVSA
jgi:hypothetical protein